MEGVGAKRKRGRPPNPRRGSLHSKNSMTTDSPRSQSTQNSDSSSATEEETCFSLRLLLPCSGCGENASERRMVVVCDQCRKAYHQTCHFPRISQLFVDDASKSWKCRDCVPQGSVRKSAKNFKANTRLLYKTTILSCSTPQLGTYAAHDNENSTNCLCYCGKKGVWSDKMLQCRKCLRWYHEKCISSLAWPLLAGDYFYNFRCSICTRGAEYLTRLPLSWVDVTDIVMYQLHLTRPDSGAFETNSEIFPYLDSIWSLLQVPVELDGCSSEERHSHVLYCLKHMSTRYTLANVGGPGGPAFKMLNPQQVPALSAQHWLLINGTLVDDETSDFGDLQMAITRSMKRSVDNGVSEDSDVDHWSTPRRKITSQGSDQDAGLPEDVESDMESLSSSATSIASLDPESMEQEQTGTGATGDRFSDGDVIMDPETIAEDKESDDDTAAETDDASPQTPDIRFTAGLSEKVNGVSDLIAVETPGASSCNDSPSAETNEGAGRSAQLVDDEAGPSKDCTATDAGAGPSTSNGRKRRKNWKPTNEDSIKQRLRPRAACVQQEPRTRAKRPNRRFAQRTEMDSLESLPTMEWSLMGIPLPENFEGPNHPFWDEAFPPTRPRVIPIEVPRIVKKWKVQPGDLIINDDGTVRYRRTRRRQSAKNNSYPADDAATDANDKPSTSGRVAPSNGEAVDGTAAEKSRDQAGFDSQPDKKYVPFTGEWSLMEVAYAGRIVRYKTMPDRSVMALVKRLET